MPKLKAEVSVCCIFCCKFKNITSNFNVCNKQNAAVFIFSFYLYTDMYLFGLTGQCYSYVGLMKYNKTLKCGVYCMMNYTHL